MRNLLIGLIGIMSACGGAKSDSNVGPTSAPAGMVDDLHVPKVDPTLCDTEGKKVAVYDLNRDGKPDLWKLYEVKDEKGTKVEILTCKQVDLDHDGNKDYVVQFDDTGAIILEEWDADFDGKFDIRVHYDKKTGKRYLVERMTQFSRSGAFDTVEQYDGNEKLETLRRDRNGDGKPDYWEQYRDGKLEKILYDDDFDGKVDRQDDAAPKPPAPPESLPAAAPTTTLSPASAPTKSK